MLKIKMKILSYCNLPTLFVGISPFWIQKLYIVVYNYLIAIVCFLYRYAFNLFYELILLNGRKEVNAIVRVTLKAVVFMLITENISTFYTSVPVKAMSQRHHVFRLSVHHVLPFVNTIPLD